MRSTIVVACLVALFAAACSTSSESAVASLSDVADAVDDSDIEDTADMSAEEGVLAFAACMRENGIEDFPDPEIGSDGSVSFGLEPGSAGAEFDREAMQAARDICREQLDGVALGRDQVDRTEIEDTLVEFAACMRDEGIDMPDPDLAAGPGSGGPFGEIDRNDPDVQAAFEACQSIFGSELRIGGPGRGASPSG